MFARRRLVHIALVLIVVSAWMWFGLRGRGTSERATEELTHDLEEGTLEARRRAAHALGRRPNLSSAAIHALAGAVGDSDQSVRRFAIESLGAAGPNAQRVVHVLIRAIYDDATITPQAVRALGKIGSQSEAIVDAIVFALQSGRVDSSTGLGAVIALGRSGLSALPVVMDIAMREKSWLSMYAIGKLGSAAKPAVPLLVRVLQDESLDANVREGAAWALAEIGSPAASAIPAMEAAVSSGLNVVDSLERLRVATDPRGLQRK